MQKRSSPGAGPAVSSEAGLIFPQASPTEISKGEKSLVEADCHCGDIVLRNYADWFVDVVWDRCTVIRLSDPYEMPI